ncbi:hypothetical protein HanLR1_Chr16g0612341 [Helianthus annuus]|nr:hypothetical protein HanLR1_Chr16g0612341 [Helianthus annuus]
MWYAGSIYYRVRCMGFSNLKTDPLYFFGRFLPPHNFIFSQTLNLKLFVNPNIVHRCFHSSPSLCFLLSNEAIIRFFEVC